MKELSSEFNVRWNIKEFYFRKNKSSRDKRSDILFFVNSSFFITNSPSFILLNRLSFKLLLQRAECLAIGNFFANFSIYLDENSQTGYQISLFAVLSEDMFLANWEYFE